MPFGSLPVDVICLVLGFLREPRDVLAFASVCKEIHDKLTAPAAETVIYQSLFDTWFGMLTFAADFDQNLLESGLVSRCDPADATMDIKRLFVGTWSGQLRWCAQIFNRGCERSLGSIVSCYDCDVRWISKWRMYEAWCFLDGTRKRVANVVPVYYLRKTPARCTSSPYRMAPFNDHLKRGDVVELQWRGNPKSPFGYWRGVVHQIDAMKATIEFPHYGPTDSWRLIDVDLPHLQPSRNLRAGGYVGGVTLVTVAERQQWEEFNVEENGLRALDGKWHHSKDTDTMKMMDMAEFAALRRK